MASRSSLLHLHPDPVRLAVSHPTRGFIPEPARLEAPSLLGPHHQRRDSAIDAVFSDIYHDEHFGSRLHGIANAGRERCHPTDLKKGKQRGMSQGDSASENTNIKREYIDCR